MLRKIQQSLIVSILLIPFYLKAVNPEASTSRVLSIFEQKQLEFFINHLDGLKVVLDGSMRSIKAQAYLVQIQASHRIGREMGPLQKYIQSRLDDNVTFEDIRNSPYKDQVDITIGILHNKGFFMDGIQSSIYALGVANNNLQLAYQYEFEHIFQLYQDDNMRSSFQEELTKRGYHILQNVLDALCANNT